MTKEMTFWEHLDDFRAVIFRSIIVIVLLMIVVFIGKEIVFDDLILAPTNSDFVLYQWLNSFFLFINGLTNGMINLPSIQEFSVDLINIELASQFFIHIRVSFYLSLVLVVPYIMYLLWEFITPALYSNEKRAVKTAFAFGAILFYFGVCVGYFVVFPLTVKFLGSYQVSEAVPNAISLSSYIAMFIRLILLMGIVFEMPALAAVLSKLGIITKDFLKKYRKHAVVVLLILAAIITPSGDAFTLFIVAMPLFLLYEISILVCKNRSIKDLETQ